MIGEHPGKVGRAPAFQKVGGAGGEVHGGEAGGNPADGVTTEGVLATPRTAAHQAPLSMGLSRQEYWSRVPLPSPREYLEICKYILKI